MNSNIKTKIRIFAISKVHGSLKKCCLSLTAYIVWKNFSRNMLFMNAVKKLKLMHWFWKKNLKKNISKPTVSKNIGNKIITDKYAKIINSINIKHIVRGNVQFVISPQTVQWMFFISSANHHIHSLFHQFVFCVNQFQYLLKSNALSCMLSSSFMMQPFWMTWWRLFFVI